MNEQSILGKEHVLLDHESINQTTASKLQTPNQRDNIETLISRSIAYEFEREKTKMLKEEIARLDTQLKKLTDILTKVLELKSSS